MPTYGIVRRRKNQNNVRKNQLFLDFLRYQHGILIHNQICTLEFLFSGGDVMRSNRPNYASTPAGSAKAFDQKPKPKRSKREINQLMLMLFFIVLPVLGLLAIFFQPIRWVFMLAVVAAVAAMWVIHAFLFPGRMILTAVYGLLTVFTLINALTASRTSSIRPAQTMLVPTPVPAATDVPFASYGTMGTSVPEEYYGGTMADDGSVDGLTETGFSGGSDDGSGNSGLYDESGTDENTPYVATVKSDAEIALENFMEKWRKGIVADMVEYTAKSWQDSLSDQPSQQLFWKFAQKPLLDWRQMAAPTGTDESNARTISIQADVNYGGKARTYQYDALVLCEDGKWAVDPDSLSTGVLVEAATPTPDPNVTPTPTPEPTPTPTPGPKTKLYYNKSGGKYYHATQDCSKVAKQYLPLSGSFTYKDINKSPYDKLEPCDKCNPPARPSK